MRYHFIDRIKRIEYGKQIVVLKGVTQTEDYFEDHFVGFPVMPGALMIEAMAQACGALIEISSGYQAFSILLMVEKMKFKKMVHPGDQLVITATMISQHTESAMLETKAEVDGKVVASGTIMVGIATVASHGAHFTQAIQTLESYFAFMLRDAEVVR
ncbi:MAG: beta-hydroxyacyl-ACP dehydratase [Chitinophagales bacterium]|nr:beta-hydroxyacyl-ACP dehydratase [Chitinophagales bacterium]